MKLLSHFNDSGASHMVNVSEKAISHRRAVATGYIDMRQETLTVLQAGAADKGDVIGVARLAAIQGAKHTALFIPLCHPLSLTHVDVDFVLGVPLGRLTIRVTAETLGRTGVEMEALSGVMAGLLTVYDMLKAIDRHMTIGGVRLLEKQGGKSGCWTVSTSP